ncbi:hypothetical protein FAGAP_3526 [Fusarium agapanthi]|uniref:Uncharacterized protein n=1 Tax=Fusarium agapanthi TaxID=1803897 RepID=A0A9P5BF69_9HYPO|nr:hypothetical protein FAGAP_3526 [Fusarium agapanthi]
MARTRPNARRRRKMRKDRERLQQAVAKQEQEEAEATAQDATSSAQALTTTNVTEATTEAANSASAHDAKETADAAKARRCKQRHLPDRHFYHREDKFDGRFSALERCLNNNIAKGRAALDADYRSHNNILRRTRERLAKKEEGIQRTYQEGMGAMEKVVSRLEGEVKNIADGNDALHEQLLKERRRVREMMHVIRVVLLHLLWWEFTKERREGRTNQREVILETSR